MFRTWYSIYVFDFLRAFSNGKDLNERYHFISSNCQEFASFVFNTISGVKKNWNGTIDCALMKIFTREKKKPFNIYRRHFRFLN